MSNHSQLLVATRKGLFQYQQNAPGQWEKTNVSFLGVESCTMVMRDPRDGALYAGLNLGHFGVKLHRSDDHGKNWEEVGVPLFPEGAVIGPDPMLPPDAPKEPRPASLEEIWALEPGGTDQPGLLWAGTIPGGLFRSKNRGENWELVEGLWNREERMEWFGGGKDLPGINSICVDPRDSQIVRVGISCGGVWVTRDGGDTWNCEAEGMRADFMPPEMADNPNVQDVHMLVQCQSEPDTMWVQHHNGIFLTTDAGQNWRELEDVQPSPFGFAVAVHPVDPQTAWFVPGIKDQFRIPVDGQFIVNRTRDGGGSFEPLSSGLPQEEAYDIVYRHGLDIDATGEKLVMGSTTGGLWVSENGGDNWICLSTHLPPIYCVRIV